MKTFRVTQKRLEFNDSYIIDSVETRKIAYTIKGKFSLSPELEMRSLEASETPLKQIRGNFLRTRFDIFDQRHKNIGKIVFPFISLKKYFTLFLGNKKYDAQGGFSAWDFQCHDEAGREVFSVSKENTLSDRFEVNIREEVPEDIALITAVAIDQKYFYQE